MGTKKRLLIADDSSFMRKLLIEVLSDEPWLEIVDTAKNGVEALEKIEKYKPDIVTLDIQMPLMDGMTCLRNIMKTNPVPVLVISSFTKEGADTTIKALEEGAVDFIPKPDSIFDVKTETFVNELIQKLKIVSTMRQGRIKMDNIVNIQQPNVGSPKYNNNSGKIKYIVGIGTSTGGPRALQEVLPLLPQNIPAAIPIVQHMPPGFTKSLANRLDTICKINVKEAEDGDLLKHGWAYIAPGDSHIRIVRKSQNVNEFYIKLTKEPPVTGHRPSANVLFSSIAELELKNTVGVIMTGMGNDGCDGLKQMYETCKSPIVAQDEESCVVYGMPKAVVKAGIAKTVVPLRDIAKEIINIVGV